MTPETPPTVPANPEPLTDDELAQLHALADGIAPRLPWTADGAEMYDNCREWVAESLSDAPPAMGEARAALIVAAVNALPRLLADRQRLADELARAERYKAQWRRQAETATAMVEDLRRATNVRPGFDGRKASAPAVPTPGETEEPRGLCDATLDSEGNAFWRCVRDAEHQGPHWNRGRTLTWPADAQAEPVSTATGDTQADAEDPLIPPMRLDELEAICVASHAAGGTCPHCGDRAEDGVCLNPQCELTAAAFGNHATPGGTGPDEGAEVDRG